MADKDNRFLQFVGANWLKLALTLTFLAVVVGMFYLMTFEKQTKLEAALEAIILTAASIAASILATKLYAEAGYSQSLRDHGVQIASGMMVLKRQIEDLAGWVNEKRLLGASSLGRPPDFDATLEHVEKTLEWFRDMTEAAVGGVAGVIGDALNQYEDVMDQIGRTRRESLQQKAAKQQELKSAVAVEDVNRIQNQIAEIEARTERKIAQLVRSSALPIVNAPARQEYSCECPYCKISNTVEMPARLGETQRVTCVSCAKAFNVHIISGGALRIKALSPELLSPVLGDVDQSAARAVLERLGAYFEPSRLDTLLRLVVAVHKQVRGAGNVCSPFQIQAALLAQQDELSKAAISNGSVRTFMTFVFRGGAFTFRPGVYPSFRAEYINDIGEDRLRQAFARYALRRLGQTLRIDALASTLLTRLLLGDHPSAASMMEELLAERSVTRAASQPHEGTGSGNGHQLDSREQKA